jgi:hypothetical protein
MYQNASATLRDVLPCLVHTFLVSRPSFVPPLEELSDAFGRLAALGIDVFPGREGAVLVAAALLDEPVLPAVVVVDALTVGDLFLRGGGGTRLFLEESERRFCEMMRSKLLFLSNSCLRAPSALREYSSLRRWMLLIRSTALW